MRLRSARSASGSGESLGRRCSLRTRMFAVTLGLGVLVLSVLPAAAQAAGNAYVANHVSSTVSEYGIGPTGLLSPLAPATVASGAGPTFGVAVSPDGKSAYVDNTNESSVS